MEEKKKNRRSNEQISKRNTKKWRCKNSFFLL